MSVYRHWKMMACVPIKVQDNIKQDQEYGNVSGYIYMLGVTECEPVSTFT